jgi:hypothetical protein
MINVYTFGNKAETYAIVHIVPHTCQHNTVDQGHSSGNTVVKILEISGELETQRLSQRRASDVNRNLPQRWIGRTGKMTRLCGGQSGPRIEPRATLFLGVCE